MTYMDVAIEHSPMLYQVPADVVLREPHCPLTSEFIQGLRGPLSDWILDTRSMLLQPGMFPCIPGWHLDFCPRGPEGQPVIEEATDAEMFTMFIGGCPTEFLVPPPDGVAVPEGDGPVYGRANAEINRLLDWGLAATFGIQEHRPFPFNGKQWHRGVAAIEPGWRWWARAVPRSLIPNPGMKIRKQVQVYVQPNYGW